MKTFKKIYLRNVELGDASGVVIFYFFRQAKCTFRISKVQVRLVRRKNLCRETVSFQSANIKPKLLMTSDSYVLVIVLSARIAALSIFFFCFLRESSFFSAFFCRL